MNSGYVLDFVELMLFGPAKLVIAHMEKGGLKAKSTYPVHAMKFYALCDIATM